VLLAATSQGLTPSKLLDCSLALSKLMLEPI